MYYHSNIDNTFIKGDNMEYIELNRSIREAKKNFIFAKSEKEEYYYKCILKELRREKRELLNNAF